MTTPNHCTAASQALEHSLATLASKGMARAQDRLLRRFLRRMATIDPKLSASDALQAFARAWSESTPGPIGPERQ